MFGDSKEAIGELGVDLNISILHRLINYRTTTKHAQGRLWGAQRNFGAVTYKCDNQMEPPYWPPRRRSTRCSVLSFWML